MRNILLMLIICALAKGQISDECTFDSECLR
jgi:hypothetical protein